MRLKRSFIYLLIALIIIGLIGCGPSTMDTEAPLDTNDQQEQKTALLKVHFIDVGQADCILIQAPTGENMLIDAGNNDDADTIVSYLNAQGVKKVDILVGTHPHEDRIGSLDTVINTFDIGKIYMPRVTHTTKTFEDVLLAVKNKGLKISTARGGTSIDFSPRHKS